MTFVFGINQNGDHSIENRLKDAGFNPVESQRDYLQAVDRHGLKYLVGVHFNEIRLFEVDENGMWNIARPKHVLTKKVNNGRQAASDVGADGRQAPLPA